MQLLAPGTGVPDFAVTTHHGEPLTPADMPASYLLVFYPFAFSRVCTSELRDLQEHLAVIREDGTEVFGVSVDHKFALRAYAEQEGLGFTLLADFWPHGAAAQQFGCFDHGAGRALRATYLVRGGRIADAFGSDVGQARPWARYQQALGQGA
ncbi:redoxin domain-containing protein [Zhihengliuella salsuginis]|uniref:Peroxiredoxin n=1 Tax=Zhihengliuella salsuginis TaxID=578222 RepID=A0ABQ3GNM0_9MICC|nr:redoxin domain-containing protein [Zhihengliuella salsuginis]GHD13691.1 peroxiredoxin [Zhihengliuella salsuginis]